MSQLQKAIRETRPGILQPRGCRGSSRVLPDRQAMISDTRKIRVPLLWPGWGPLMPGIDFKAVRASIPIAEVLHLVGFVPCTSTKQQQRGPCPVHQSASTRSTCFSVNLAKNTYQCFKCG